ncbi:MAG: ABC transporter substrate-binding protein [Candidatus Hydrogenedentes bacterium]|nr:ABC transporter substrate-binding protein [Candidatus Hydrogenedentota bacterium]
MRRLSLLALALCVSAAAGAGPYREAPDLAKRVADGALPPVSERLPEEPVVVTPVNEIGKYGGVWRRVAVSKNDLGLTTRMAYEPLVRWDRTGTKVVSGVASHWEIQDGGKAYVFHLRKGMRWSDGAPFTSDDVMFVLQDLYLNPELFPVYPGWLRIGGAPPEVSAPDACTVVFHFREPFGIFLEFLAFHGNEVYAPKHYLKQFHPAYTPLEELKRLAKAERYDLWLQLFLAKNDLLLNPDRPTIAPFRITVPPPARRYVAERNPYYWKVDPEGNQLPYIDRVEYTEVQNAEMANIKAMTGEVDFQDRLMNPANYTLFTKSAAKGGYRVLRDPHTDVMVAYINQYSRDEELRPILQDRRFRIALSVAINREELINLVYSGMARPSRGVGVDSDLFYLPEYDQEHIRYDPALANRLLDEVGMARGRDGMRRLPNGRPFRPILHVHPAESGIGAELWQLVADYWQEVGLGFVTKTDAQGLSILNETNGNSDFWAYATSGMHWMVDPIWYVPWQNISFVAPLYGQYVSSGGRSGVKPSAEFQRLLDWYLELRGVVNDEPRRLELGHRILGQWADECYAIGVCRPDLITIVSNRFRNVPEHILHSYQTMTPGYIGIEQFYIDEEGK